MLLIADLVFGWFSCELRVALLCCDFVGLLLVVAILFVAVWCVVVIVVAGWGLFLLFAICVVVLMCLFVVLV